MPKLSVTIEKNLLPKIGREIPRISKQLVLEEGFAFEDGVVGNIIKYQTIDTSTLMGSVAFDGEDTVADNVEYGIFVDKGTVWVDPRPFWSDEMTVSRRRFPERFQNLERFF